MQNIKTIYSETEMKLKDVYGFKNNFLHIIIHSLI